MALRGDTGFGYQPMMHEQRDQPYLFKPRLTKNVTLAIEGAMRDQGRQDAGCQWQGKRSEIASRGLGPERSMVSCGSALEAHRRSLKR